MFNFQSDLITNYYNRGYNSLYPSAQTTQSKVSIVDLPKDLISEIFSNLNTKNIGFFSFVCKDWNALAKPVLESKKAQLYKNVNVFTPEDWMKYGGKNFIKQEDIQKALSSFPLYIDEVQCPIWPEKKLCETHVFVWLPRGLTISTFGDFLEQKFPDNRKGYEHVHDEVALRYKDIPIKEKESGWIAMTKDLIPGSLHSEFLEHKNLIKDIKCEDLYAVPKTLELIVCIGVSFFKSEVKLFNTFYTRSQEEIYGGPLIVRFNPNGLYVDFTPVDCYKNACVAAVRKFF